MKKLLFTLITAFMSIIAIAQPQKIIGTLVDFYGTPLDSVSIEILGTAFHTQSNSQGYFEIDYAPSNSIQLIISHKYTETVFKKLSITQKSHYPLGEVRIFRRPHDGLISLFGKDKIKTITERRIINVNGEYFVDSYLQIDRDSLPEIFVGATVIGSAMPEYFEGMYKAKFGGDWVKLTPDYKIPTTSLIPGYPQVDGSSRLFPEMIHRGSNYFVFVLNDRKLQEGDLVGYVVRDFRGIMQDAIYLFRIG